MTGDLILGVDPGVSGALAFLDYLTGDLVEVVDMPVHKRAKGGTLLDEYGLARLIDERAARVVEAWTEIPTPRPGNGVANNATSLRNYGIVRGVIVGNFIPLHDVAPVTWKRSMKVTGDKDEARHEASKYWPHASSRWALKGQDGRAEAALIAMHGRKLSLREVA